MAYDDQMQTIITKVSEIYDIVSAERGMSVIAEAEIKELLEDIHVEAETVEREG